MNCPSCNEEVELYDGECWNCGEVLEDDDYWN